MLNVGILIFNDAEVLDFAGPFEVFSVSAQVHTQAHFNVFLISENTNPIEAVNGLVVTPKYSIHNHPKLDVLILAGSLFTYTRTCPKEHSKPKKKIHRNWQQNNHYCWH